MWPARARRLAYFEELHERAKQREEQEAAKRKKSKERLQSLLRHLRKLDGSWSWEMYQKEVKAVSVEGVDGEVAMKRRVVRQVGCRTVMKPCLAVAAAAVAHLAAMLLLLLLLFEKAAEDARKAQEAGEGRGSCVWQFYKLNATPFVPASENVVISGTLTSLRPACSTLL